MANIRLRNEKEKLCSVALHHTIENLVILENKGVRIGNRKIILKSLTRREKNLFRKYATGRVCLFPKLHQVSPHPDLQMKDQFSSACITVVYLLG